MACKAVAVCFIYLALSAHAMRLKKNKLQHKNKGSQPPPSEEQQKYWNLLRGQEEAKVKGDLYAKTAKFREHPSMQPRGSGGELMTFFKELSEENKQLMQGVLHDDVEALLEPKSGADVPNAAADLQAGINQWLQVSTSAKYQNCAFSFEPLRDLMLRDMKPDDILAVAPKAITSIRPDVKPCQLGIAVEAFLHKHKHKLVAEGGSTNLVRWSSGINKGNVNAQNPKALLGPGVLLEVAPAEMLGVAAAGLAHLGAVSGEGDFFLILLCIIGILLGVASGR